ncbi:Aspartic proteinase nepenthesin-2 [Hordeum vulgare]|nr:Aspartic proteinase nepenthesin-2 [Hordeum vulgare]KAI5012629.1 hypothetical protein ZWY2020_024895 [Hordeum vulgare]
MYPVRDGVRPRGVRQAGPALLQPLALVELRGRAVPCADSGKLCPTNGVHLCALDGSCSFVGSYGAGSVFGSLGTEAFTFQSGAARLGFGCVSLTRSTKGALNGASRLIGLGRGRLSLIS